MSDDISDLARRLYGGTDPTKPTEKLKIVTRDDVEAHRARAIYDGKGVEKFIPAQKGSKR